MSFELTPEKLQSLSVKCAAQFMSKQASLSQAIAKEAQELELNPEQIKRTIEATNTITYLRHLEDAQDRTKEFPLADYKEVMACMVLPEKQASESKDEKDEDEKKDSDSDSKEDKDEDEKDEKKDAKDTSESFSEREKVAMLSKETLRCIQVMEKIAYDKVGLQLELENAAHILKADNLALEKLAHVAEKDAGKLALLCNLEKRATEGRVFTAAELRQTEHLYDLYKEAKALVQKEAETLSFIERAATVLEKEAFVGKAIASAAGLLGKGIGRAVSGTASAITSPVTKSIKNFGAFRSTAKAKGLSTKDAVADFDKIKSQYGSGTAKTAYNGTSPNIIQRQGLGKTLGKTLDVGAAAATGLSLNHTSGVWDTLQKN